MGRGDRKSRKGKIFKGSYGNTRPKKVATEVYVAKPKKVEEKKEKVVKKATVKKTAAKKKSAAKKATTKKKTTTKKA